MYPKQLLAVCSLLMEKENISVQAGNYFPWDKAGRGGEFIYRKKTPASERFFSSS